MKHKVMLINCIVENHIRETLEVASFTTPEESAKFTEFVLETEKSVWEVFFGKDMSIDFNLETQTMELINNTDKETVITITIDIRKDFEVEVEDKPVANKVYSVILTCEGEVIKNWIFTDREKALEKIENNKDAWALEGYIVHPINTKEDHPYGTQYANAKGYWFEQNTGGDWEYASIVIVESEVE